MEPRLLMACAMPPAPGLPDLISACDSGFSSNDDLTNYNNAAGRSLVFDIPGVQRGNTVFVKVDGTVRGSVVATSTTARVTLTPGVTFADGTHTIVAYQSDCKASPCSASLAIAIDTVAPAIPAAPDLATASDSGISQTDNISSVTTPTFAVSATPYFRFYDGATLVSNAYTSGTQFTLGVQRDGVHTYGVSAVDAAGNESATATFGVTIDTAAPTLAASTGGSTSEGGSGMFSASASDTSNAFTIQWTIVNAGNQVVYQSSASGTNSANEYNVSYVFPDDGTYTATVEATDVAGSTSSRSFTLSVSNVAPVANVQTWTASVAEGSLGATVSLGDFYDPSDTDTAAGFRFSYDFNDDGVFDINSSSALATVPASYYDDGPSTLTIRARVSDKDDGFTDYLLPMSISSVAPVATFSGNTVDLGSPTALQFSNSFDPSVADTNAGFRYSYDFNDDGTFELAETDSPIATHTFAASGTYTIRGRIADKDGAYTEYTTSVVVNYAVPVSIPDASLQAAVRSALNKPEGDITDRDMQSLTSLIVQNAGITDLTGLEHAVNLQYLNVFGNQITSIAPLAGLTHMYMLVLTYNQISDLSPLAGLPGMGVLLADGNQISDLASLAGLTQLTDLSLQQNQISDLSPLSGLMQLNVLDVAFNYLDTSNGSPAMTVIQRLQSQGTSVSYTPQSDPPHLTISDDSGNSADRSVALGGVNLGATSRAQSFSLVSQGWSPVRVRGFAIGGADANELHVKVLDGQGNPVTVTGGSFVIPSGGVTPTAYTIQVYLLPTSEGSKSATITFTTDDPINRSVTLTITATAEIAHPVSIPDAGLQAALRAALNKPEGDILSTDMQSLTGLGAGYFSISDLTGLQYATNLTWLWLSGNQITDLSPLSGLPTLYSIGLDNNLITDISVLQTMPVLSYADVTNNYLDTSAGSPAMTTIQALQGRGATVSYQPQKQLPVVVSIPDPVLQAAIRSALNKPDGDILNTDMQALTFLYVGYANVSDLTGLEYAVNLQHLDASANRISSVAPLAGLTQLTYLDLQRNQISDLNLLANLTNLTTLFLSGNGITDVTPLSGMTQLTMLDLGSNQISDVTPLAGLTQLTNLDLRVNQVRGLAPLASLTHLQALFLFYNQISDLTPLAGLAQLTDLGLTGNQISDVAPLANLTQLQWLPMDNNQVNDITPLANLTRLTYLDVAHNHLDISDGSPAMVVIQALQNQGTSVNYSPQSAASLYLSDDSGEPYDHTVSLGTVGVGSTSMPRNFSLSNSGDLPLYVTGVTTAGPGASELVVVVLDNNGNPVTLDNGSFTIPSHSSGTIRVYLQAMSGGEKSTTIAFLTNDPSNRSVTLTVTAAAQVAHTVAIPDPGLQNAIRWALNKPEGDITDADMQSLTGLWAQGFGITDLTGLQYATNMSWLYLGGNQITDISAVQGLPALAYLDLSGNPLDLSSGSAAMAVIQALQSRGVYVLY